MLILLFILMSVCSVNAMEVALTATSAKFTDEVPPSLSCTATIGADENLTRLSLYYENNQSTTWAEKAFDIDMQSGGTKVFTVSGLENATYTWNCLALSNDSIETWAGSNNTFEITFTTAAAPATDSTPPSCSQYDTNITVTEDSGSWNLDDNMSLATNISCSDANALTYAISEQTGSGGTFSLSSNDILSFATGANATGTKIVVISVSDGANTVYISAQVTVTPVNDPPTGSIIPSQTWNQNMNKTIDLDDYFSDVDDESLNYSYAFNSSSPHIVVLIKNDGGAILTPEADWYGSETITFTAYDAANLSFISNEVLLTVQQTNATNSPPSIDSVSPTTDPTISVGESQTFSITKSDPDGDNMNVSWYVDGVIQEGKTGDSFVYTASIVGSFIIKVAISDGQASDTNNWALTVKTSSGTNQTAPPSTKKTGEDTTVCGDGNCDGDENCNNCEADCGCPDGYACNKNNKCIKERKASNIILLVVVLGLFAGGAGVGIYLYKKKQEQEIFGGLANTPISLPPKAGEPKKEEVIVKKPQEPVKKSEKPQEKPLKDTKTTSQVLLKNFIKTNLAKGKSLEEIKAELRKVGWTDEQINDAYTAAQLDEAFS